MSYFGYTYSSAKILNGWDKSLLVFKSKEDVLNHPEFHAECQVVEFSELWCLVGDKTIVKHVSAVDYAQKFDKNVLPYSLYRTKEEAEQEAKPGQVAIFFFGKTSEIEDIALRCNCGNPKCTGKHSFYHREKNFKSAVNPNIL